MPEPTIEGMIRSVSLVKARELFLDQALDRLAADDRVLAVMLGGSTARGEADQWSDLDLVVVSAEEQASVLSGPREADSFGDLLIWVDCSFNAPAGGTMAFSRFRSPEGMVLVDWTIWPQAAARRPVGTELLWSADRFELEPFDGNVVELTLSRPRRQPAPYSRQQRAEWELCMSHIAASRPARRQDAAHLCSLMGITDGVGAGPADQLEAIGRHVIGLEPWIAPRAYTATIERLEAVRNSLRDQ